MPKLRVLVGALALTGLLALSHTCLAQANRNPKAKPAQKRKPAQQRKQGPKAKPAHQGKKSQQKPIQIPRGKTFAELDKDDNGFLSMEEIYGAIPKRGHPARNAFERADRDGNDWLTAQEYSLLARMGFTAPAKKPGQAGKMRGKPGPKKKAANNGGPKRGKAKRRR
jgi:hypothetical protein